jgi:type IV pilus assembly protein PilX
MIYSLSMKKQSGVVLIVSLIMLLLLTIIGITSMQVTGIEEKMSGNIRNKSLAFQSAETALRDSEVWIASRTDEPAVDAINVWALNAIDPTPTNSTRWWHEVTNAWWGANAIASSVTPPEVATVPYTVIEFKHFASDTLIIGTTNTTPGMNFYQVTSRGTGGNDKARIMLQSVTTRRF